MRHKWNPVTPTVVVADDDPAMRQFVRHVLTDAGYNVRTAMDGSSRGRVLTPARCRRRGSGHVVYQ
jgi:CheY-like chemotaxis protein